MTAWLLLGDLLICILWQELSHWPSKFSRENPSTGQGHAGLIRGPPAVNQQEQCIMGVGGNSCLKIFSRPFWQNGPRLPDNYSCIVGLKRHMTLCLMITIFLVG